MPLFYWLGGLITSALGGLVSAGAQYATKRLVIIGMVAAGIATFTIAFFAAVVALINTIVGSAPAEIDLAVSWFVPSNAGSCMAAILTAHALRWVYEWNIKVIQFRL